MNIRLDSAVVYLFPMFPDQIKFWYFQIVFIVWKEEMGKGVSKSLQGVIRVALVKKESSTKP